jgi:DNA-directed RNA polymerase specialized sigma24 family protein
MSPSTSNRKSVHAAAGRFASTQWSLALAAGRRSTPEAEQALAKLCGAYWPPIYAYLRRRGYLAPEAEDLTQSFFVRLLEKNRLRDASPERGKFRSFLLASLKHFLANEWDRAKARKRGGGAGMERTVFLHSRGYYRLHLTGSGNPDTATLGQIGNTPDVAARFAIKRYNEWRVAQASK